MSWLNLTDAKARLNIDCADPSHDQSVQEAMDYAEAVVEVYCQRNFALMEQTQGFFPMKTTCYLENWPVQSVEEIKFDGVVQTGLTYKLDPLKGVIYFDTSLTTIEELTFGEVTYTAGFDPIPTDLMNAALDIMAVRYNTKGDDPSKGPVKFERIDGSVSVSYGEPFGFKSDTGTLTPYLTVLNSYRSERTQGAWQ